MAYNEKISSRIREALSDVADVEEKEMFGGICYMVNDKMCIGVIKDEMICRIDPQLKEELMEKNGVHEMLFSKMPMKGFVIVSEEAMKSKKEFDQWVKLCLDFNVHAIITKNKVRCFMRMSLNGYRL